MEIKDMVGMMSTGALLAMGVMYLGGKIGGSNDQPQPQTVAVVADQQQIEQEPEIVSRTEISNLGQSTAQQLQRIVALSAQGLSQAPDLTPEQQEIVTFFERAARDMNQTADRSDESSYVQFSNMAVQGLKVRYFYRVGQTYEAVDKVSLFADQQAVMQNALCGNEAVRTLLSEYGFEYTYTYISTDSRHVGALQADKSVCA
jgi:hypothetical protein